MAGKPKYSKIQVVYDLMKFGHEGTGTPTWAANTYPGSFVNDDGVYVEECNYYSYMDFKLNPLQRKFND